MPNFTQFLLYIGTNTTLSTPTFIHSEIPPQQFPKTFQQFHLKHSLRVVSSHCFLYLGLFFFKPKYLLP